MAILSTTGILTAIQEGKVAVSVTIEDATQSRDISIEYDDWNPFTP